MRPACAHAAYYAHMTASAANVRLRTPTHRLTFGLLHLLLRRPYLVLKCLSLRFHTEPLLLLLPIRTILLRAQPCDLGLQFCRHHLHRLLHAPLQLAIERAREVTRRPIKQPLQPLCLAIESVL